jgi:hypothetical protein
MGRDQALISALQGTKKNLSSLKTSGDKQVLIAILISTIILLSFLVAVFTIPRPTIPIFPLWVLGEKREIPAPTMNISLGRAYSLFIGGQNLMGKTEYCTLAVKLRNMASPLPFTGNSSVPARASPLPSIMNFAFAQRNNETWETAFTFTIFGKENPTENSITIDSLVVNGAFYNVMLESFSDADSGFFCQFFFELWLQDEQQGMASFSGVWVSSPILRIGE